MKSVMEVATLEIGSAIIYSVVVSCQRRDIDPLTYIRDVLMRLHASGFTSHS